MKGKVLDWNDDRGFGFILPENRTDKFFFHISDVKTKGRRPQAGDLVDFDVTQDAQQRLKAKYVVIEGLSLTKSSTINQCNVEPMKKTLLDYLLITALFLLIGAGGFLFYETKEANKLVPFGVVVIAVIIVLLRQKKPKEKHFTCACCKVVAEFDKQTIQAWNKGMIKLYCSACHQQWLSTRPEPEHSGQSGGGKSGCLGMLVAFALFPALIYISIYPWFS